MSVLSVNNRQGSLTQHDFMLIGLLCSTRFSILKLCYLCCGHCWERWPEVFIDFIEELCVELVLNVSFVHGFIFFKCRLSFKHLKGDCQSWRCFQHEPVLNEPLNGLELCRKLDWVCTVQKIAFGTRRYPGNSQAVWKSDLHTRVKHPYADFSSSSVY